MVKTRMAAKLLFSGFMLLCMIAWLWPPLFECNPMASTNKLARSLIAFLIRPRPDAFNMVEWFACPTSGDGKQEPPPSFFLLLSYTFRDVVSRPYFLSPPFCRHRIFVHYLGSIPLMWKIWRQYSCSWENLVESIDTEICSSKHNLSGADTKTQPKFKHAVFLPLGRITNCTKFFLLSREQRRLWKAG